MTFTEFQDTICNDLREQLGEEYRISMRKVPKNNDIFLNGLIIEKKGIDFSPSIYLEPYYKDYQEGRRIWEIEKEILQVYESCNVEAAKNSLDMKFFMDFEEVRKRVAYKLINFEKNRKLLEKIPFIPYLDLAIVFYCRVCSDVIGIGSILITNEHMEQWGITTEQLYETARDNTPRLLPCEMKSMKEIIREMLQQGNGPVKKPDRREAVREEHEEEALSGSWREKWAEEVMNTLTPEAISDRERCLFVLGNKDRIQGACTMIYQGVLQDVADYLDRDIFILPSSIHEVLILPDSGFMEAGELRQMVKEVNETQVQEQEVLSEHVYRFDRRQGRLLIAC